MFGGLGGRPGPGDSISGSLPARPLNVGQSPGEFPEAMSFYSALVLAADDGVRPPSRKDVRSLLVDLALPDPHCGDQEFCNLANHVAALFVDTAGGSNAARRCRRG
jgi:hypothetical protein